MRPNRQNRREFLLGAWGGVKRVAQATAAGKLLAACAQPQRPKKGLEAILEDKIDVDDSQETKKTTKGKILGRGLSWGRDDFYLEGRIVRTEISYTHNEDDSNNTTVRVEYNDHERPIRNIVEHDDKIVRYEYTMVPGRTNPIIEEAIFWDHGKNGVYDQMVLRLFDPMKTGPKFWLLDPKKYVEKFGVDGKPHGPILNLPSSAKIKELIAHELSLDGRVITGEIITFTPPFVKDGTGKYQPTSDPHNAYQHRDRIIGGKLVHEHWRVDNPRQTYRLDSKLTPETNLQQMVEIGIEEVKKEKGEDPRKNLKVTYYRRKDTGKLVKAEVTMSLGRDYGHTQTAIIHYDKKERPYERVTRNTIKPEKVWVERYRRKKGRIVQITTLGFVNGKLESLEAKLYKRKRKQKRKKEETLEKVVIHGKYLVKHLEASTYFSGRGTDALDDRGVVYAGQIRTYFKGYWKALKRYNKYGELGVGRYQRTEGIRGGELVLERKKPQVLTLKGKKKVPVRPYHNPSRDPRDPEMPFIYDTNILLSRRTHWHKREARFVQ